MRQAKKRAWVTNCGSNLRQIGVAVAQYASDNAGKVPIVYPDSFWLPGHIGVTPNAFAVGLAGYVRNTRVYQCPAGNTCSLCYADFSTRTGRHDIDYRFNPTMGTDPSIDGTGTRVPKPLDQCRYSRVFYIASDRHSGHHLTSSEAGTPAGTFVMVMADCHLTTVRPYAKAWSDGLGQLK